MQFNIQERLLLINAVGAVEGNLATLRIVRDLQQELGFSEEEHKKIGFVQKGDQITWDPKVQLVKEVSIGPAALDAALAMFKSMDAMQKLTMENLPIYERLLKAKHEADSPPKLREVGAPGA